MNFMEKKKKVQLVTMSKRSLKDFNQAEAQGWIIDQFVQIEDRIDAMIIGHFQPQKEKVFKTVVLNSSVLSIGGKIKILTNIGVQYSIIDKLRRLTSIRNGFSHSRIGESMTIIVPAKGDANEKIEAHAESYIDVMNSSGKIIRKNAYDFLVEFLNVRNELRKELP